MQKAQQLAGLLGDLIQEHAERGPIAEIITVVDFDTCAMEDYDKPYIAGQTVWRLPSYLCIDGVDSFELKKHEITDNRGSKVEVREVPLPSDGFVSTHLGYSTCKVLLTPTSLLEQK